MAPRKLRAEILMNATKRKLGFTSDYQLAKFMDVEPAALGGAVRSGKRKLPLHVAAKMAALLNKDTALVISQLELEREKNPKIRKFWQTMIYVRTKVIRGPTVDVDELDQEED